jgi:hypothetical protein
VGQVPRGDRAESFLLDDLGQSSLKVDIVIDDQGSRRSSVHRERTFGSQDPFQRAKPRLAREKPKLGVQTWSGL